ncbi:MAG: thioredoxin family protein [Desulfobaccales bacterium]
MADDITQVRIGKNLIGLRGIPEIFQEVAAREWATPAAAQEELFQRVAGQNYIPSGSREDYRQAVWREFRRFRGESADEQTPAQLEIKVLGLGCSGCRQFYQRVIEILAAHAIVADLQYITDPALLKPYEVRAFPALVINGRLVLAGRIPEAAGLARLILAHAEPSQSGEGRS